MNARLLYWNTYAMRVGWMMFFLIDQNLKQNNVQKAPAKDIDVKALINEVLVSDGDPNVDDVTDAINKKMNKKE